MQKQRSAIALLVTIMFVMLISVAIGYGLRQINRASKELKEEQSLYQNSMILSDILEILQNSRMLTKIAKSGSVDALHSFLSSRGFYSLDIGGQKLLVTITSACSRLNINALNDVTEPFYREYFSKKMLDGSYIDFLRSFMSQNKVQNEYNNVIFSSQTDVFREYIASKKHLQKINSLYIKEYHNENLKDIAFDELFCYGSDSNRSVDLNYATTAVWELIVGASPERAAALVAGEGSYKKLQDLHLSELESRKLAKFQTSFFEPYLEVTIEVIGDEGISKMSFEYAIKTKRGYDFVLEI